MRIGIKFGSAVLVVKERNFGLVEEVVDRRFLEQVARQMVTLMREGHQVFLVTSGAVASDPHENRPKSVRAAVGWGRLIGKYRLVLGNYKIEPASILVTARDLDNPDDLRTTLEYILKSPDMIAILNANDPVDGSELQALGRYADNDLLFSRLCQLLKVDQAIIGFDRQGVLDAEGNVIRRVRSKQLNELLHLAKAGNGQGYGRKGMYTKMVVLSELASLGISANLVPAKANDALLRAYKREKDFGTIFQK